MRSLNNEHNKKAIFLGDGVNDSQAIAEAFIGIAIDSKNIITCNSADVVILGNSLSKVVYLLDLCEFSFKIIKQNYLWAFI